MNRSIFAILLSGELVLPAFSQYENYIKNIQLSCDKINNSKYLTTYNGVDPSGVKLTGYFKYEELVKLSAEITTSWGLILDDYYFDKDQLMYVYIMEKLNMPDPVSGSMVPQISFTGGYYFLKNQVIGENNVVGMRQPVPKKGGLPPPAQRAYQYAEWLRSQKG